MEIFANDGDDCYSQAEVKRFLSEIENTPLGELLDDLRRSTYDLEVCVRTSRKGNKVYNITQSSSIDPIDGTAMFTYVEVVASPNGDIISKIDHGYELIDF